MTLLKVILCIKSAKQIDRYLVLLRDTREKSCGNIWTMFQMD